jgi:hypothetical protein
MEQVKTKENLKVSTVQIDKLINEAADCTPFLETASSILDIFRLAAKSLDSG